MNETILWVVSSGAVFYAVGYLAGKSAALERSNNIIRNITMRFLYALARKEQFTQSQADTLMGFILGDAEQPDAEQVGKLLEQNERLKEQKTE